MRSDPVPALKAALGEEIARVLRQRDIWDVAVLAGTHRSELSRIRNGHLERVSLERLIRILACVRRRVEMKVVIEPIRRPQPSHPARASAARGHDVHGLGGMPG